MRTGASIFSRGRWGLKLSPSKIRSDHAKTSLAN
jgi:hypothetical protein